MLLIMGSCKDDSKKKSTTVTKPKPVKVVKIPKFSQDSAYVRVQEQLAFGYRYPGSEGQTKMIAYLDRLLSGYGAKVYKQDFTVDFMTVTGAPATNVIASFNPDASKRIMLSAHWDSRFIAEKDPDVSKQNKPIMGADDGASGTAVLLEIARLLKETPIDMGVDLVFFDAEDQGDSGDGKQETWCLGSQYWGKNPHVEDYKAKYGILLDMVGAKNAEFGREAISMQIAPQLMNKVWELAGNMGYGKYFQNFDAGGVTDDHYYVFLHRRFPIIDVINTPKGKDKYGFGAYHHTHDDNIDIIDKNTLKAVGKVITAVVYNESMNRF